MIEKLNSYFFFFCAMYGLTSCTINSEPDQLRAQVYDSSLFQSDINAYFGQDTSSINTKQFVDSWIRNELIIQSTKLTKEERKEIEALTENYKKTLAVQKQKEKFLNSNLNLDVDSIEIRNAYDELKSSYKLKRDIFKYHLVVLSKEHPAFLDINNYFKNGYFDRFYESLTGEIELQYLDSTKWHNWLDLSIKIPLDKIEESEIKSGLNKIMENENFIFFLRTFDFVDKNQTAPLSYMEDYLINAIIENRKVKLIEEYSNDLYQSALNKNKLIIN